MSLPERCDVLVVGGGPAGSLASTFLAQHGYDVVLIDKNKHPRYHVGESLIPGMWNYTDAIGASEKIASEGFIEKSGAVMCWQSQFRAFTFSDFGFSRPALHVERDRFDEILLRNAEEKGVRVFEEIAAVEVVFGEDEVTTRYRHAAETETSTIRSRYVVDGTGQNALLGRQLGIRSIDQAFRSMSIWGYFTGSKFVDFYGNVHSMDKVREHPPVTYVSSMDETGEHGWSWHIPLRDSTSVGLVIPLSNFKEVKRAEGSWETYFLERCRELPVTSQLLEEAEFVEGSIGVINDYSYRSSQLAGRGFYLIGDAAAFVDPIFSIGIVLGMYSAYAAAWAIHQSLRKPLDADLNVERFSAMVRGRIEISRSLALPQYRSPEDGISDLAKTTVKLERHSIRELMWAVSALTTRSQNYHDMLDPENSPEINTEKIKSLSGITF